MPEQPVYALREPLLFSLRRRAGETVYVVEDPVSSRFYHVGRREYHLMVAFDGRRDVATALQYANSEIAGDELNEVEAKKIIFWLLNEGLLTSAQGAMPVSQQKADAEKHARLMKALNLISFRFPLLNPDKLLNRLIPSISWFLGWPLISIWLVIGVSGLYQVLSNWSLFVKDSAGVFYAGNWLWLAAVYLVLKVFHELFHGLISKRYGGQIYEAGIIVILFMPIGYVDATSSWRFNSRWQRFHVAVAGMFIELLLAGVAAWIWSSTQPGMVHDLAFNAIIIASISTLVFNANPLMKFDGYFALSDTLDIPNLYSRGRQYVLFLARKYILGMKVTDVLQAGWRDYFIRIYGVASFVWRMMIVVILTTAAWHLFYGLGIVIALLSLVAMFGIPAYRMLKFLLEKSGSEGISIARIMARVVALFAVAALFLTQFSWSWPVSVPAIVDYSDLNIVRAKTEGVVKEVHVSQNQQVSEGDLLISLDNFALRSEVKQLKYQIKKSLVKSRILYQQGALSSYQAELNETSSLEKEMQDKLDAVKELEIRSPGDGRVIGRDLKALLGVYIKAGDELLIVANESDKELKISIDPAYADFFRPGVSHIKGYAYGQGIPPTEIAMTRVDPRATTVVLYPALIATAGGDLEVKASDKGGYELLNPRFDGRAEISKKQARRLYAGSVLTLTVDGHSKTLWQRLQQSIRRWVRHLSRQAGAG